MVLIAAAVDTFFKLLSLTTWCTKIFPVILAHMAIIIINVLSVAGYLTTGKNKLYCVNMFSQSCHTCNNCAVHFRNLSSDRDQPIKPNMSQRKKTVGAECLSHSVFQRCCALLSAAVFTFNKIFNNRLYRSCFCTHNVSHLVQQQIFWKTLSNPVISIHE